MSDPDYRKIAAAMGLATREINSHNGMNDRIQEVLSTDGPVLCVVDFSPDQRISPMLKAGRPIEDANPLLDRELFLENMIIEPLDISRSVD